jgi:hypothetical protein
MSSLLKSEGNAIVKNRVLFQGPAALAACPVFISTQEAQEDT